jgi:hypothetical protein
VGVAAQMLTRTLGSPKGVEEGREQWEYRLRCGRVRKGVEGTRTQGSRGGTGAVGVAVQMQTRTQGSHKEVDEGREKWE